MEVNINAPTHTGYSDEESEKEQIKICQILK